MLIEIRWPSEKTAIFKPAMEKVKINSKTLMEIYILPLFLAAAASDVIAFH